MNVPAEFLTNKLGETAAATAGRILRTTTANFPSGHHMQKQVPLQDALLSLCWRLVRPAALNDYLANNARPRS